MYGDVRLHTFACIYIRLCTPPPRATARALPGSSVLDILDYHTRNGTYIDVVNTGGLSQHAHFEEVRAKWAAVEDPTTALLLCIDAEDGTAVYTSKLLWERNISTLYAPGCPQVLLRHGGARPSCELQHG